MLFISVYAKVDHHLVVGAEAFLLGVWICVPQPALARPNTRFQTMSGNIPHGSVPGVDMRAPTAATTPAGRRPLTPIRVTVCCVSFFPGHLLLGDLSR